MSDFFSRIPPFLQDYVWSQRWEKFRDIQVSSFEILFNSRDNLIITSGTASGKTEAALFPCITYIHENPKTSVQLLYIGPLKALINDQFSRINELLQNSEIKTYHWHGDVDASEKKRLLRLPSGILQITPESLESLLMNHPDVVKKLFKHLEFIIIDELHAFLGQDRGTQVLCQISRLERIAACKPRRIGLSATISDYSSACRWLSSGTERAVQVVNSSEKKKFKLSVQHITIPPSGGRAEDELRSMALESYYSQLYNLTQNKKCIIFANSRQTVENTTNALKLIARKRSERDVFVIHHGSISGYLRNESESALKDNSKKTVAIATATLELGIDIGGLDCTIQIDSPNSCSSFVQRLGRSGRRGAEAEMKFLCLENKTANNSFRDNVPFSLLKTIAIIELYVREKWIEPTTGRKKPLGLLYHQTMSELKSRNEMTRPALEKSLLALPPFYSITPDEFGRLIDHLLEIKHIEMMDEGSIIIGLEGEKRVNHFSFYAVFRDDLAFSVIAADKKIGTIQDYKAVGDLISLTGKNWIVIGTDDKRKKIFVKETESESDTKWRSGAVEIHPRIMMKIKEILDTDDHYTYLSPNANNRLDEVREYFKQNYPEIDGIIECPDKLLVIPWLGSKQFETLVRILKYISIIDKDITIGHIEWPFFVTVYGSITSTELRTRVRRVQEMNSVHQFLITEKDWLVLNRYEYYLPRDMLIRSYLVDGLDFNFVL